MLRNIILSVLILAGSTLSICVSYAASGDVVHAITNCNGTRVVRTEAGQMMIEHNVGVNLPGCIGDKVESQIETQEVDNSDNLPGESQVTLSGTEISVSGETRVPKFNPENGPALDIRSTDITNYRTYQMTQNGVRYVNVTRSVKMRNTASMSAKVNAYLMDDDAVVMTGSETGWVRTQGANVLVTDTGSNTVVTDTTGKAKGYIAAKFLRKPTASDLVRIGQADQAYWSDIAHVNVAHLVNVRAHPWYGAKIRFVLSNQTPLYVVSTVDNWSEVLSDDRKIHGYVRSDYITVEKIQRVDKK